MHRQMCPSDGSGPSPALRGPPTAGHELAALVEGTAAAATSASSEVATKRNLYAAASGRRSPTARTVLPSSVEDFASRLGKRTRRLAWAWRGLGGSEAATGRGAAAAQNELPSFVKDFANPLSLRARRLALA